MSPNLSRRCKNSTCGLWLVFGNGRKSRQEDHVGNCQMSDDRAPSDLFQERLKAARNLREWSQEELATKAGMPPSSIGHYESGSRKPSFDTLRKLANVL